MLTPPHSPRWSAALAPGTVLGGRYRLGEPLGRGGMGRVYDATNVFLGKRVAVKVLDPALSCQPASAQRFLREARAASSIEHRNVVEILDYGEGPGLAYYVMERLEGHDLEALLGEGGRLPWTSARELLLQIARGLRAAHAGGIIHCDVKPSNIFVVDDPADDPRARVRVLDFGIARTSPTIAADNGTELLGTTTYMAPEQVLGAPPDPRTDVYAMGVLMYRVLTGRVPFAARDPHRVLAQHASEQPVGLRQWAADVPAAVEALVLQCLAKRPQLRLPDMRTVEASLEAIGATGDPQRPAPGRGPLGMSRPLVAARVAPTQPLGDFIGPAHVVRGNTEPQTQGSVRRRIDPLYIASVLAGSLLTLGLAVWFGMALLQPKPDDSRSPGELQSRRAVDAPASEADPQYDDGPRIPTTVERDTPGTRPKLRMPFGIETPPSLMPPEPSLEEPPPAAEAPVTPKSKRPATKRRPKIRRPKPKKKRRHRPRTKPRPKAKVVRPYSPSYDAAVVRKIIADAIRGCHGTEKAAVLAVIEASGRVSSVHHRSENNAETRCLTDLVIGAKFSAGRRRTKPFSFQAKP